ncbi:branched-chain amino acid ABC transporter permease [Bdellovibrio sp. 22V]|uniref:branched-chain amino acid ABC transporter permease n=1 Tax=Bdellovibrio TaxID=958 RepID=UPI002543D03E|nr:branched-chain amino acid ABC transporter permease [Bdellovibrio sp. 22V]WII72377.1 branched-chain amino acid ABC transporter permease [Bdellovibrio sp. 22V]
MKFLKMPLLALAGLSVLGLIFDFGFNAYIQLTLLFVLVNCLMSMSLNLVNGYTGQFSLGHAGFMAIGAYFSAYANTHWDILPPSLQYIEFFVWAAGAGLTAAAAGFLVGLPSLRLKGDYLAIVTLGFGEIIRVALLNMDFLGGPRGYSGIPGFGSFLFSFIFASLWGVICFFTIWRVMHSTYGRGFLSVREDEIAAEAMGINTTKMKVRAFVLSSFFAGVAGALFAHFTNFINPSSFTFLQSVNAVIMVVLGGMGSMTGSIVAAFLITALPEVLRPLQDLTGVDLRMVIYSLALILVMILRPKGLFGDLELTDVWRKYVRRSA